MFALLVSLLCLGQMLCMLMSTFDILDRGEEIAGKGHLDPRGGGLGYTCLCAQAIVLPDWRRRLDLAPHHLIVSTTLLVYSWQHDLLQISLECHEVLLSRVCVMQERRGMTSRRMSACVTMLLKVTLPCLPQPLQCKCHALLQPTTLPWPTALPHTLPLPMCLAL